MTISEGLPPGKDNTPTYGGEHPDLTQAEVLLPLPVISDVDKLSLMTVSTIAKKDSNLLVKSSLEWRAWLVESLAPLQQLDDEDGEVLVGARGDGHLHRVHHRVLYLSLPPPLVWAVSGEGTGLRVWKWKWKLFVVEGGLWLNLHLQPCQQHSWVECQTGGRVASGTGSLLGRGSIRL